MKDGQLLRVKVIKTKNDLPKEKIYTLFNCNLDYSRLVDKYYEFTTFDPNDEEEVIKFPRNYNWYLQPIEEQKSISDEEIEEYLTEKSFEQKTKEGDFAKAVIWKFVKWMRDKSKTK